MNNNRVLRTFIWLILVCIAIGLTGVIIGVSLSLLVARYSVEPIVFLTAGAIAYIVVFLVGAKIFFSHFRYVNVGVYKITVYIIELVLMVSLGIALLLPLPNKHGEPLAVEGLKFWNLSDGLRISYVHLTGNGDLSLPPVIFLHGGPGVPDMAGDAAFFGELVHDGFDVYIYDQIGSGRSSRLKDPREYTVERDVTDLEFIRQKIGAEKIILIGHSYGGEIAAHYMSTYKNHVEKVVFSSPGAIDPEDTSGGNLTKSLTSGEKQDLFKALLQLRVLMTYGLLQINPLAAIQFAGDSEMDARFDKVYEYTQPSLHLRGLPLGPKLSGLGFYANQTPQSASAGAKTDIRKMLWGDATQTLIIKGSSDYLSWSSAIEYKKVLKNSFLVYFSKAGHNIYQDQPDLFMEVLRSFLNNRSLPVDVYNGIEPPVDYEGVR